MPVLAGRTGLSPVMVGRAAELDRLVGLLGARPGPTVALVTGEAGIGKTRLVQELVDAAPPGTLVLAGQADPGALGRPLELVLDALDGVRGAEGAGAGADDPELAALDAAVRDVERGADERVRAAADLVRRLTAGRTALVVLEDLHWADPESVAVFERLAGLAAVDPGPGPGSLLLVGTYRPDGLSRRHPAAEALLRIERRHAVTHVRLDRLDPAAVSDFLTAVQGSEPSFRTVDELHGRTGGNPFFLEQLLAASPGCGGREDVSLPWTVAELVRAEVDDLAPPVRQMLSAAAVLGRRVHFDLLAAVLDVDEDDLIARLRVAIDHGLLAEDEPDVFSFRHELLREAVEGGLLGRERRRLHERALAALRAAGSRDHVALAHHARGAGRFDDLVSESRLGARESLARGSSYQALVLAEAGLAEAPDDLDLLALATRAAWLAGQLDDARAHGDAWLARATAAADTGARAEALAMRARIAFERGEIDDLTRLTDELVSVVDGLATDEQRAQAMAAVAQFHMLREHAEETIEWADKALALAEANGLERVRLQAMAEKGSMLLLDPARGEEARRLLEEAAAGAERVGDHVLAARCLNNLVWHARKWSDLGEVRALIERMRTQAEAAGFDTLAVTDVAASLAQLAAAEGDLDGAIAHLDAVERSTRGRLGWTQSGWRAVFRAGLALEAGDLDAAERYTAQAKPPTARTAASVVGLDLHLAARRGDLAAARARLAELVRIADDERYASPSQAHDLVAAGLAAGLGVDELRPLVERAGHFAGHRLGPESGWWHMLAAQLAEAVGEAEEAADRYASAAELLGHAPGILAGHRGTAHVGAAANLLRLGRDDEARAHAAAARRLLARWRGWRVEALAAVERRLGIGAEVPGPDVLTPREREVVALLAEGLTNAQIADRLYISPRTAAVHVSNVLSKLGMGSRAEVAAWAVREGVVGPDGR